MRAILELVDAAVQRDRARVRPVEDERRVLARTRGTGHEGGDSQHDGH
jgi:hypothetical protein